MTVDLVERQQRYEIRISGRVAGYVEFSDAGMVRTFTCTVIAPEFAGRGLASQLIGAALTAERNSLRYVRAACPFVLRFIERHPEFDDLVVSAVGEPV